LNTYFANKLAQNIHTETSNIYEVVHSLVRQQGYEPSGYIASELVVSVTVNTEDGNGVVYAEQGDQLYLPQWFKINTGLTTSAGEAIYYCLPEAFTYDITEADTTAGYAQFDITLKQGVPQQAPLAYTGSDIVGNQIILPAKKWDMGMYPYDGSPSIVVVVGDDMEVWTRESDFYDDISGLVEIDNSYMLSFDKYKRYALTFSNTRNIPTVDQDISVYVMETLGLSGSVASKVMDTANNIGVKPVTDTVLGSTVPFISNITKSTTIYNLVNTNPSFGGADPQELDELKEAGKASAHSQNRNVTKLDYKGNLEKRSDVTKANVWGEQEESPGVLRPTFYNKAYISLIPTEWDVAMPVLDINTNYSNIPMERLPVTGEFVSNDPNKTLDFPDYYNSSWTDAILEYSEPRKMLGIWEEFILPDLVYFRVDFGLKVSIYLD
jgi:hypothetical protein